MKKIVLVYPRFLIQDGPHFNVPLSLLHLGSFIESKGYKVVIIDGNVEDNYEKIIVKESKGALVIGISAMTDQISEAVRIIEYLKKEKNIKLPLVLGGVHATLFPKETVEYPLVDYAVIGEGELSFLDLLKYLDKKMKAIDMEGVAYKGRDGQFNYRPRTNKFNFEEMPLINYRLLGRKILKQFPNFFIAMITSRGCPHQCAFCINTIIKENSKWRALKAERVIAEIKNVQKYKVKKIFFWDENFFVQKNRAEEILNLLEKEKIKISWFANARTDYFRKNFLDSNFLKRLKKNGCLKFGIGAESGSQRMLDIYNKGTTPAQIINCAKSCYEIGIAPTFSFMIGAPNENKVDMRKTIALIGEIYKICPSAKILGPQLFRPYPGSLLYDECLKSGWHEPKSLVSWAKIVSTEFMETNPFKSPWMAEKKRINIIWFYSSLLVLPPIKLVKLFFEYCKIYKKNIFYKLIGSLGVVSLSSLGKIRYKLDYYNFPIEVSLLRKFRSVLSS